MKKIFIKYEKLYIKKRAFFFFSFLLENLKINTYIFINIRARIVLRFIYASSVDTPRHVPSLYKPAFVWEI